MTYSQHIVLSAVASAAATMCVSDASSSSGTCIPYLLFFYLTLLRELERLCEQYAIESYLALCLWYDLSSGKTEDISHDFIEIGMLLNEVPIEVAIDVITEGAFRGHGVLACCLACSRSLGDT